MSWKKCPTVGKQEWGILVSPIEVLNMDNSWLISDKSLKELNFPNDWKYDLDMCRWKSEKHKVKNTFIGGMGRKKGDTWEEYIYITDKMLNTRGGVGRNYKS